MYIFSGFHQSPLPPLFQQLSVVFLEDLSHLVCLPGALFAAQLSTDMKILAVPLSKQKEKNEKDK